MKGEIKRVLQFRICLVDHGKDLVQLESGTDRLHTEVILLVDHEAESLGRVHHNGASSPLGRMLAADEVALNEHLLFQR